MALMSLEPTNFSNKPWQFPLFVDVDYPHDSKYSYNPRSDAELRFSNFPLLILEVISNENETDRTRLLLQASCLARLGNALRESAVQNSTDGNPFIAAAVYINSELQADWYRVYQPNPQAAKVSILPNRASSAELLAGRVHQN